MTSLVAAFAEELPGVSPDIYDARDFRAIADLVHAEAGIVLPPGKAMLVYSRIAPRVRNTGSGTFAAYIDLIQRDPDERYRAIAALTTNHTFFYRESHHFEHFAAHVRPGLVQALEGGRAVRMWSAGCSSGEETWSLVMTLLGEDRARGTQIASRNVRVLASDLADHALAKAAAAIYPAADLKAVPEALRRNWTVPGAGDVSLTDEARRFVRFRMLNLLGDWPFRGQFDVIFCRNVMIYFDQPTKERLVERFAHQLAPGGHLYIGHSERASGPAAALLEPVGPTIYRRKAS